MQRAAALATILAFLLMTASAFAAPPKGSRAVERALHAASVTLENGGCAGVLAESPGLVFTARHCVEGEGQELRVRFTNGMMRGAWVEAVDEHADQALLVLDEPVAIEPLPILRRPQIAGTVLFFEGNPSKPRFQRGRLDRIGRCPGLPHLPNALFTSIHGVPGDSGAPVVDAAGRVLGLVHGGARCEIVTPSDTLGRLLDRVLDVDAIPASASSAAPPSATRPL